jgi:hypothetical protein
MTGRRGITMSLSFQYNEKTVSQHPYFNLSVCQEKKVRKTKKKEKERRRPVVTRVTVKSQRSVAAQDRSNTLKKKKA